MSFFSVCETICGYVISISDSGLSDGDFGCYFVSISDRIGKA